MRLAEAKLTHATLRARQGDVSGAVAQVEQALAIGRRSAPSLAMVAREVTHEIARIDPGTAEAFSRDTLHQVFAAAT
jgi:microcompartment protein CcmL/EutN